MTYKPGDATGVIFDVDHFAVHDGPGIRTVIYLKGCPLRCLWCHSPESQSIDKQPLFISERCRHCETCLGEGCPYQATVVCGRAVTAAELAEEIQPQKTFFDASGGGVTLSGGEVLFQSEFAVSLLARFRGMGIHTLVETSGMGGWNALAAVSEWADAIYYDIKTLNREKHIAYTGADNAIILDNLKKLAEARPPESITLRVALIPGYNDTYEDVAALYALAISCHITTVHLLRYNPSAPAKYEWLGQHYAPGVLQRQNETQMAYLTSLAPTGLDVWVV